MLGVAIQETQQEESARLKAMSKDEILEIMLKERSASATHTPVPMSAHAPPVTMPPRYTMSGAQPLHAPVAPVASADIALPAATAVLQDFLASQKGEHRPPKAKSDENIKPSSPVVEPVEALQDHKEIEW